jgi:hypothetical protein
MAPTAVSVSLWYSYHSRHLCSCVCVPADTSLEVTERTLNQDGDVSERVFQHKPLLVSCTADTPARAKMARLPGHASFLGCGACTLRGTNRRGRYRRKKAPMHFLGYSKSAYGGLRVPGEPTVRGRCGDSVFKLTHEEQLERADKVDRRVKGWGSKKGQSLAGCHGLSPIIKFLEYAQYGVFACSAAHAFLLGLVKDFWNLLLCKVKQGEGEPEYSIKKEARKVMAGRASHVASTLDQSRPYHCIVTQRGNWVMEDWMNWTEIRSIYIMSPERQVRPHAKPTTSNFFATITGWRLTNLCIKNPVPPTRCYQFVNVIITDGVGMLQGCCRHLQHRGSTSVDVTTPRSLLRMMLSMLHTGWTWTHTLSFQNA